MVNSIVMFVQRSSSEKCAQFIWNYSSTSNSENINCYLSLLLLPFNYFKNFFNNLPIVTILVILTRFSRRNGSNSIAGRLKV